MVGSQGLAGVSACKPRDNDEKDQSRYADHDGRNGGGGNQAIGNSEPTGERKRGTREYDNCSAGDRVNCGRLQSTGRF